MSASQLQELAYLFPLIAAVIGFCSAIVGGVVVAFANHVMTLKRERERKTTDVRIEYLIESWAKIERASYVSDSASKDQRNKFYDDLEQAVAKIILLGDVKEVDAAKKFARDLAAGSNASANELLNSLRDSLREKLKLERASALDLFFRMQREKL